MVKPTLARSVEHEFRLQVAGWVGAVRHVRQDAYCRIITCTRRINHMTGLAFKRPGWRTTWCGTRLPEVGPMLRYARSYGLLCWAALFAIALMAASASATPAASPLGTWATSNGHGVIAIAPCGEALCGRIVGIDRAPTAPMPTDVNGRSQCGLTII